MPTPLHEKSSVAAIRDRFDQDVDRFSDLETGQTATIDAPLAMELVTRAAIQSTPRIRRTLDVGCGAGNSTLCLLQHVNPIDCDLVDLSMPMLQKARERIAHANTGVIRIFQDDIRDATLPEQAYDVIVAAAVLHHLRDEEDWKAVFRKLYGLTAPGGSLWITDLVSHENAAIQSLMWDRYGAYLSHAGGRDYRDNVFRYIDREDSPRPLTYQLDLLRHVGFYQVDILHKNSCFAAFGAVKTKMADR